MSWQSIDDVLSFQTPAGIRTNVLPPQLAMLLLDNLEAPADFMLVHWLARAVKQGRNCCLVTCSREADYYTTVLKKQGVQLKTHIIAGTCAIVDAAAAMSMQHGDRDDLSTIQAAVQASLRDFQAEQRHSSHLPPIIFFDDLSALLWSADPSPGALAAFYRQLRSAACEHNATLVSIFHADSCFVNAAETNSLLDAPSDQTLKLLIRLSHLFITTRSLRPQMMGELLIERGPCLGGDHPSLASMPRHRPVQYKIEETGPVVWSKGTGAGFL